MINRIKDRLMYDRVARFRLCANMGIPFAGRVIYNFLIGAAGCRRDVIISQGKIGMALGLSKSAVSNNLRRLKEGGYIEVIPRYSENGGRVENRYRIKWVKI